MSLDRAGLFARRDRSAALRRSIRARAGLTWAMAPRCWCSSAKKPRSSAARTSWTGSTVMRSGPRRHHISPEPSALPPLLDASGLARAGIRAAEVGYGQRARHRHPAKRAMEARALLEGWGEDAAAGFELEAQSGHSWARPGDLEAALTVLAIRSGGGAAHSGAGAAGAAGRTGTFWSCGRPQAIDAALSTSFGFGGRAACSPSAIRAARRPRQVRSFGRWRGRRDPA